MLLYWRKGRRIGLHTDRLEATREERLHGRSVCDPTVSCDPGKCYDNQSVVLSNYSVLRKSDDKN